MEAATNDNPLFSADPRDQVRELIDGGRFDEAAALLRGAIESGSEDATGHNRLAFVLAKQVKLAEAERHFRRALEFDPDNIETLRNVALCLSQQGKHRQVLDISRRLIALEPHNPSYWHELGRVNRRLQDYDAAILALEKAIQLQPDLADAHHDLALTLNDRGDNERALAAYRKSLELKPDFVEALNNLGVLLEGQGQLDEAIRLLRRAVELKRAPDLLNNLGVALSSNREYDEAIRCYKGALALDPNYAAALNNLGNAQRSIGENDQAITSLRKALRIRPDYAEAYNNLAIALVQSGRHQEAMRYYNQAIHFRPDYSEAHMNRSLDRLAVGDFEGGWIEYEWRWRGKQLRPRYADRLRWDGSSPAGKRIFIHFEQGLGDTFQFIRYARQLKKLGAYVIAEVQSPIVKLLRLAPFLDAVVSAGDELPEFDFHAPMLSLPGLLRTNLATIPADVPYLEPNSELVKFWREKLDELPGIKIGIAWQGNPEYRGDRHRSIPLKHFAPLSRMPGVTFISLQKGFGAEKAADWTGPAPLKVFESLDADQGPFMDTAAIMKNLDLMITSDTALPHLAGALGIPVWMAIPIACDWRWLHGREDSPWYPTMRLFRQRERDNWEEVFERISRALAVRLTDVRAGDRIPDPAEQERAEVCWRRAVDEINASQLESAEQSLIEALHLDPTSAKVHHDLGVVRGKRKRPELAVASFRRALELAPELAIAWGNLGLAFLEQDQIEEAISHLQRALTFGPNAPETFNNLGVAFMRHCDPASAAENYQRALRLRPDYAEAHLNLARALLIQGKFEEGWLEYEWRWRCAGYRQRADETPRWGGEPLGDRTILLHAEQGLGDTIQFVRFAQVVKESGGTVLLECQPPLAKILERSPGVDRIIPAGGTIPRYDVHAPLMSVPGLLGTRLKSIPASIPYIHPHPALVRSWGEKLKAMPGFKVGIGWQGNQFYDGDRNRSFELKRFAPLAKQAGVQLISLQKGAGAEQLADLVHGFSVIDFGTEVDEQSGPFMDTAAIMTNLDLVITSDSALAHLAGALGIAVWVVLPKSPDFRWLLERDDSPWYPTMRIFRQHERGNWDEVMQRVTAALHELMAGSHQASRPRTLAAEIEASTLHEEGRGRIRSGDLPGAAEALRRAVQVHPQFAAAHLDLGVAYAQMREFDQAVRHFREAIRLEPHEGIGYANLGLALLDSGAVADAAEAFSRGIQCDPESLNLYKFLGRTQLQLGPIETALATFQEIVRRWPHAAEGYYHLGIALERAGKAAEAIEYFQQAIALDPHHAEASAKVAGTLRVP